MAKPVLKALVLADHLYRDARTGKWIIAGTFTQVMGIKLPIELTSSWVYLSLTDFRGQCQVELEINYDPENRVLARTKPISVQTESPLQTAEVSIPLPKIAFKMPGAYSINVLHDGEILGSHRITVGILEQQQ